MKKIVWFGIMVFSLVACNNSAELETKADSLAKGLDTTLEKIGDSAKAKGERTLDAIKEKVDEIGNKADKKDSIRLKNTR